MKTEFDFENREVPSMAGYYNRRESKAAMWCLRISVLAIPYLLLAVFMHRSGSINSEQVFWLFAFGIAMLIASILCGVWAAVDLWEKGSKGGRMTVNGVLLATILLAPFAYQLVLALNNPTLNDIATDVLNPPQYLNIHTAGFKNNDYDKYEARLIIASYPDVINRHYFLPTSRVSKGVVETLQKLSWKVVASENIPEKPVQEEPELEGGKKASKKLSKKELSKKKKNQKSKRAKFKKAAEIEEIIEEEEEIIFQAKIKSIIMKLESDIVIRLSSDGNETQVDMRASSQWGAHDFGNNAKNISKFFTALDAVLVGATVDN